MLHNFYREFLSDLRDLLCASLSCSVYALHTMSSLLLPPPLPEKDRKATYDYRIGQNTLEIVRHSGDDVGVVWSDKGAQDLTSSDTVRLHSWRYEWDVGLCYAPFTITRPIPGNSVKCQLSHWGVYFLPVDPAVDKVCGDFASVTWRLTQMYRTLRASF